METLEHIQEQAFTIHEDGTLHVPPARNRRLFAPGQNAWLKACRHWVQQGHKEDPCDVFPALERLINLLDEPSVCTDGYSNQGDCTG